MANKKHGAEFEKRGTVDTKALSKDSRSYLDEVGSVDEIEGLATMDRVVESLELVMSPPERILPTEAAAKYFVLPEGERYDPMVTPYMIEPTNQLINRSAKACIFVGPARTGKMNIFCTKVPTPTGYKPHGMLEVGDEIFGDDGKICRVTELSPEWYEQCIEITFNSGDKVVCSRQHEWTVQHFCRDGTKRVPFVKTLEAQEMINDFMVELPNDKRRFTYAIPLTKPLDLPEADLPIDPYVLGFWLGDGCSYNATLSVNIDDLALIERELKRTGDYRATVSTRSTGSREVRTKLQSRLKQLGLIKTSPDDGDTKRIPMQYLRASIEQRWELLRGLLDSDGCVDPRTGVIEFTSSTPNLAEGVLDLLAGLGIWRNRSIKEKAGYKNDDEFVQCKPSHRIGFICYSDEVVPFKSERRISRLKPAPKRRHEENKRVRIVNMKWVGKHRARCITVDSHNSLYLVTSGMIPTHNSLSFLDANLVYIAKCNPSDVLVVHMTDATARRYSRMRVSRFMENSPEVKKLKSPSRDDDNILLKQLRNGTSIVIASPAATNLSAADYKFSLLTDYDRMGHDTSGEVTNSDGDIYEQAKKRNQTFLSAGMTMVESSPSMDLFDVEWKSDSHHDAPPVGGILGLYNQGDRRMWYWTCPHKECAEPFPVTPGLDLFALPGTDELVDMVNNESAKLIARRYAKIYCPHCGGEIDHQQKTSLNEKGYWKSKTGEPNSVVSYWLGGVAAKFQTWEELLEKYLSAFIHYLDTGDDAKLKATLNVDQAVPFVPFSVRSSVTSRELEKRATANYDKHVIPKEARYITASVDVQATKFVVQVEAVGVDNVKWLINRFDITHSERKGTSGNTKELLDPAGHLEDWDLIRSQVIEKAYVIESSSGEPEYCLLPAKVVCDSGGKEGVTENAYAFWEKCRKIGLTPKFDLIKGEKPKPKQNVPFIRKSVLGKTSSAARKANVAGKLPLYLLNTTLLKDTVMANLKRSDGGPGTYFFPDWLKISFYEELTAESRSDAGWENLRGRRNESFDLCCYNVAATKILIDSYNKSTIDWDSPPAWARPLDDATNINVRSIEKYNSADDEKPVKKSRRRVGAKIKKS